MKVDVYSFGLILWELVAGTIPYEDMTPTQAAFAVVNKNLRPSIPLDCPLAMKALIEQCWSLHPDKRPKFWQIVKVLEEFELSLARDGTLNLVQNPACHDHKKGLLHCIQKLGPNHQTTTSMPEPKFSLFYAHYRPFGFAKSNVIEVLCQASFIAFLCFSVCKSD